MKEKILEMIFERISNIEDNLDQINNNIHILLKDNDDKKTEQLLLMTRFENLTDFIREQYNVVIEEKEEYIKEELENNNQ